MSYTVDLQQKPSQNLKQMQRLIMSRQMQQAILLLQMPVQELSSAIDMELEQNPLLVYPEEESFNDDSMQDMEEESPEESINSEKELQFDEHDFELLKHLDENFEEYLSDASFGTKVKRTLDQERLQNFLENTVCAEPSLFQYLMNQAEETFENKDDLKLAESLIGNLDENGFLKTKLEEIAILQGVSVNQLIPLLISIQTFHPPGVGARDLRESLLIQLNLQGKKNSFAYLLIEKHFEDLLHNRIPLIQKSLHCSAEAINASIDNDIVKLDLHPGTAFSKQIIANIVPDVLIRLEGDQLKVVVNEDPYPSLGLNNKYLRMLKDDNLEKEAKAFIQQKIISAKWLLRNIFQRNSTIEKITEELTKKQKHFFIHPEGKLVPLTMKTIAEELQLHESTIARAVANKYVHTPKGTFPLRYFFTNAVEKMEGESLSSRTVKDILEEILRNEDKQHPLSDEVIAALIQAKGIKCARRTVAKYRKALYIGNAQQRRKF